MKIVMLEKDEIAMRQNYLAYEIWETQSQAACPPYWRQHTLQTKKGGMPMITYAELIQFNILIVALIGLCYKIFKGKK